MASSFKATVARNYNSACVDEYTPDTSATFVVGDLVVFNTGTQKLDKCGADPALIAGISFVASGTGGAQTLTENGKLPIYCLQSDTVVSMASDTTPAESHIGTAYGIADGGSGVWKVDIGDTSNTRVDVIGIDVTNGIFYVRFKAANLQFDGIAS